MNNILSEKEYQHFIMDYLQSKNGYVIRSAKEYNRAFAMDTALLFQFLKETQPDAFLTLENQYKEHTQETIINYLNTTITNSKGNLLDVLKNGVEIGSTKLEFMYNKPATSFNTELVEKYEKNIFSVMEEVWISEKERIDLVLFLNGFAIMFFELKCNMAGQSYKDAIKQYRTERNPKNRLFLFKVGCLVNFAMDLEEVYMTTKLTGHNTFFLPFNKGRGEGVHAGAGNPISENQHSAGSGKTKSIAWLAHREVSPKTPYR